MKIFNKITRKFAEVAAASVTALPSMAHAASFDSLGSTLYCSLIEFTDSPVISFAAGLGLVCLLVMMVINEGNGLVSWGLKIAIAVAAILSLGSLLGAAGLSNLPSC